MSQKGFDESSLGTSSDPFSSGLSSPLGSELGSTETESEDEDFMAELTRQMANYMLEDDEEKKEADCVSHHPEVITKAHGAPAKWSSCNLTSTYYYCDQRFMSTSTDSTSTFPEGQKQSIEVYQLKNQPLVINQQSRLRWGREPTNQLPNVQQFQRKGQHHHQVMTRHGGNNSFSSPKGSGMRAVFLGSTTGSSGTGVFLPRLMDNQAEPMKKRPVCSTVLVPARVLQALESHLKKKKKKDVLSQSNGCGVGYNSNNNLSRSYEEKRKICEFQTRLVSNTQEMQLPEDWTY